MRRMWPAALAALAVSLGTIAPAQAASGVPHVAEAAGSRFPERAYALTLPRARQLMPGQVRVFEDGRPVERLKVVPANAAGSYRFGVVLAIDTSTSMEGLPMAGALDAARSFVRHRNPGQPVAVVTFGGRVSVPLGFTTDSAAIDRALATVTTSGGGTHLVDAVARGVALLKDAKISSGSVVLLSDGTDTGSAATIPGVSRAAKDAGARIFSIGLRSPHTDYGSLNLLAAESHGEFSAAGSVRDLTRVYDRLGSLLSSQYLITYRSRALPGEHVAVRVEVDRLSRPGLADYLSPRPPHVTTPPYRRSAADALWRSAATTAFIGLVAAALLVVALWVLLRPRGRTAVQRMASYVGEADPRSPRRRRGRVLLNAERTLERRPWWSTFKEHLEIARIGVPPMRLLGGVAAGTLAMLVLLPAATGSPLFALPAFLVPLGAWTWLSRKLTRQRRLFEDQLPDNLQMIASAMRAGHSFSGAFTVVVEDAPEPTRREFVRVIADERLGVPVEDALRTVVRRMKSKDLEQVALVAALQRETGGNSAEVLERVTQTVRDRLALRRMVKTLTAQGRMSRWVVSALPVVLLGLITVINPAYVRPLYTTGTGQVLLVVATVLVVSGSLVIKRIVDIKV